MRKTFLKSAVLAIAGVGLMAGGAMALPTATTLDTLQNEFDARTQGGTSSIDVMNTTFSDTYDSYWNIGATGGSFNAILFEIAGYAEGNSFGIYDQGSSATLELFAGTDSNLGNPYNGATTTLEVFTDPSGITEFTVDKWDNSTVFSSQTFGYYLNVSATGNTYYSDTSLNSDSYDHMRVYQGLDDQFSVYNNNVYAPWLAGEYALAWEDLHNGGDQDFTDFVVMVESVQPIPEPATMLLFGAGLAGLAGLRYRKSMKKA